MISKINYCSFIFLIFISYTFSVKGHEKPKCLWFDAAANFKRFETKDSITFYLEKAKSIGFNQVVIDVKPNCGEALYTSKILSPLKTLRGYTIERDWDYLQYFLDESKRLNLKVTISTAMFPAGKPMINEGLVYKDEKWKDKTCIEYLPDNSFGDIKDNNNKVAAFLNPVRTDVREFALNLIKELISNYDVDGLILDYCRFPDDNSDFSDYTRNAFEKYLGTKIDNYPDDIFKWNENGTKDAGKYYNEWWAFRSHVISSFIKDVRSEVKKVDENISLEYWAASWIHGIYGQGQNWASPKSDFSLNYSWGSKEYNEAGFAPYLDVFQCGTYLEHVYGENDPVSIEYGLNRAKKLVAGDCKVYGTIYALNHEENISDAVSLCLEKTEGLMVFDIVQVIEMNLWEAIKSGIDRVENKNIANSN